MSAVYTDTQKGVHFSFQSVVPSGVSYAPSAPPAEPPPDYFDVPLEVKISDEDRRKAEAAIKMQHEVVIERVHREHPEFDAIARQIPQQLEEHHLSGIKFDVVAVIDMSGSMQPLIQSGALQAAIDQVRVLTQFYDEDGILDVIGFGIDCTPMKKVSFRDPITFINKMYFEEMASKTKEGQDRREGTNYAPPLIELRKQLFGY